MFLAHRRRVYIKAYDYCTQSYVSLLLTIRYCEHQKQTGAMKYLLLLCAVIAAVLAEEKYSAKFDNINIQEILESERLLKSYANCLLDKGKCSAEGKELKDHMQSGLETGCKKCTDKQKENVKIVIQHLIGKEPEIWRELTAKFDPEGTWRKHYEDEARANGIVIPSD